jgi:hypothetical protein
MSGHADLIARLGATAAEAVAALQRVDEPRCWIDELGPDGDAAMTDAASHICEIGPDALRRHATAMAGTPQAIGILVGGALWLFSVSRLLAWIERRNGLPARIRAAARAKKASERGSLPRNSSRLSVSTAA